MSQREVPENLVFRSKAKVRNPWLRHGADP